MMKTRENMEGRYVIVTGANTGIGFASASAFAKMGAHVVLACRNVEKGNQAKERIFAQRPKGRVEVMQLDLSQLSSVEHFAREYTERKYPLHVLVHNAGLNEAPVTEDGFEGMWQVNYLSHFLLTSRLMPILKRSGPSRIVVVSSSMHRFAKGNFLKSSKERTMWSYPDSKLAQVYMAYQLHRKYADQGVTTVVVNPGAVDSDIWRSSGCQAIFSRVRRMLFLDTNEGALTTLAAAFAPATPPSQPLYLSPYWVPRVAGPLDLWGPWAEPQIVPSSKTSHDVKLAEECWEMSCKMSKAVWE